MTHLAICRMVFRIVTIAVMTGATAACGYKGPLFRPYSAPFVKPPPLATPGQQTTPAAPVNTI